MKYTMLSKLITILMNELRADGDRPVLMQIYDGKNILHIYNIDGIGADFFKDENGNLQEYVSINHTAIDCNSLKDVKFHK